MKVYQRLAKALLLLGLVWVFFSLMQTLPFYNRAELIRFLNEVQDNTHAGLLFVVTATVLSVFFVPISWFIAAGAVLFGLIRGFVYSLTAATAGAILSFTIAYYLKGNLPDFISKKIDESRLPIKTDALAKSIEEHGLKIMFLLRNIPLVPFVAVNYVSGLSNIRFRTFVIGSFLGMLPGVFVSTFFFTRIAETASNPIGAAAGIAIKAAYISLIVLWDRKGRKQLDPDGSSSETYTEDVLE